MKCGEPGCQGSLRVTHTYAVELLKFQRAVCDGCGMVYRLDTIAVPKREGAGAREMASRAKKENQP